MAVSEQRDLIGLKAAAFDALLDTEEVGIAVLDTDLRYRDVNPLLAKFNGVSVDDHIGRSVADVLPDLAPVIVPELTRVLETGEARRDLSINGLTPSLKGQDSRWEASYIPIFESDCDDKPTSYSDRHVTGILALAVNRSLEQQIETAKEEAHQLKRRILDSLFTFVAILSPNGVLIDANRAPLEAAGIALEDVLGKRFWDCIWWNYSPAIQTQLRDAVIRAGAGETVRYDVSVRTVGDTRIIIDFMIAPLLGKEGEVTHLVASANDISERKSRETDLILSEKRFRRVFDSTADGLVMINENGEILLANSSMASMFGYTLSELYGCTVEDLIPAHKREQHRQDRMEYQVQPIPRAMAAMRELMASRKDGSEFPVEIALTPLQFPEGTRVLATVVDISVQKQIQASLIKALKEKTSLLNEVHHRVKNNLQVVSSLLNLQANSLPDDMAEYFLESQSRVKAMALMHQQLYEHKTYESIGAAKYISELVALIQRSYSGTSGHIETRVLQPDTEIYLSMDQALPFGLLLNELLTNAMKHAFKGQAGGDIRISLQTAESMTTVIVEDNGIGVPEDIELGNTSSLGFQLIPGLVDQLEGSIALIRDQGTRYEICFEAGGHLE